MIVHVSPELPSRARIVAKALASSIDGLNRVDVGSATRLSAPTIQRALADLRTAGWLEVPAGDPPPLGAPVRLSRSAGLIVAVDVGRRHIRAIATDVHGSPLLEKSIDADVPIDVDKQGAGILALVLTTITRALSKASRPGAAPYQLAEVRSLGIGMPTPVDAEGHVASVFVPQLSGLDLADQLRALLAAEVELTGDALHRGLRIAVAKDADLGALAEWRAVDGKRVAEDRSVGSSEGPRAQVRRRSLIYVKASHGIDAGVVHGGRLLASEGGMTAQLGHMWVPASADALLRALPQNVRKAPERECPRCMRATCLENMASGTAQLLRLRELLKDDAPAGLRDLVAELRDAPTARPESRDVLLVAAKRMGAVLAEAARLLDPSRIVVGGLLAMTGGTLLVPLREALKTCAGSLPVPRIELIKPGRVDRIELDGAVELARQNVDFFDDPLAGQAVPV